MAIADNVNAVPYLRIRYAVSPRATLDIQGGPKRQLLPNYQQLVNIRIRTCQLEYTFSSEHNVKKHYNIIINIKYSTPDIIRDVNYSASARPANLRYGL